ncbi:hypothetical protein [Stenotrophomonas pigmentata]|uniref:hypothetical protein n=1 Tax=Stenotrophomonas pigmentata TaxID=3055080 RepID=UPI0026EE1425|nr:hypothetical protein [Stenotrophomonas sp. 610A2]
MYWLFLLLALGAFLFAFSTTQAWLLVLALLAALVFLLLWAKGLYVARFGGVSSVPRPLHAAELQALRAQFQAKNDPGVAATATTAAPPTATPPPVNPPAAAGDRELPQP